MESSYCNGEYIHELSEDESLSTRRIVKLVSLIMILLFTGAVVLVKRAKGATMPYSVKP